MRTLDEVIANLPEDRREQLEKRFGELLEELNNDDRSDFITRWGEGQERLDAICRKKLVDIARDATPDNAISTEGWSDEEFIDFIWSRQVTVPDRIRSFASLPNDMCLGMGVAASDPVISAALEWHERLLTMGFDRANAVPGNEGEISVTVRLGSFYIEVIAEVDGTTTVASMSGDDETYRPHLTLDEAIAELEEIKDLVAEEARHLTGL